VKQEEQFAVVVAHVKAVGKGVLEQIEQGKLPTTWDARELIQFVSDKFKQTTTIMAPEREKSYRTEINARKLL